MKRRGREELYITGTFVAFGAAGWAISSAVLYALVTEMRDSFFMALIVATIIGEAVYFLLLKNCTFRKKYSGMREIYWYGSVKTIYHLIKIAVMNILVYQLHIWYMASFSIVTIVGGTVSLLVARMYIFNRPAR
jgi:putative flippase GtrA